MQYQINKEAFDALSDDLKKEYTLDGDTATLKIEGENAPSAEALAKANEKHRIAEEHRKKAEKARDEAEAASEKFREDLEKASGKEEIAKLKEEHAAAMEKIRAEREAEKAEAKAKGDAAMIKEMSTAFANEHFIDGVTDMLAEQIGKRLNVETVNGESVIRPLDADGKPSIISIDDLKQEFLANEKYKAIIKGKAGSGGGANPSGGGGATGYTKLSDFKNGVEEARFANENPEAYQKMVDAG